MRSVWNRLSLLGLVTFLLTDPLIAFLPPSRLIAHRTETLVANLAALGDVSANSRRSFLQTLLPTTLILSSLGISPAFAATRPPLDELIYKVLRVREATQQEARLIKSGKFKDVQRANVKLAIRFMLENYRLGDAFVGASAYLDGTDRRVEAGQIGQSAVQNLYTILEYFDSADVQNLKVGTSDAMSGKEELVLKGLDATRKKIDDFLSFFPKVDVETVKTRIERENELNVKEFDPSLGTIVNLPPAT